MRQSVKRYVPSICAYIDLDNKNSSLHQRNLVDGILFFPTCQVRVVRFYVSLFSFSFSSASSSASSSVTLSCRDSVSSVWHAGAQLRSCEFSVACRTPTAILVSSVWRAGPQPRSCEFSVASRTPTAIL